MLVRPRPPRAVLGLCSLTALTFTLAPASAEAFQIGSAFTSDCHEQVTIAALARARANLPALGRIDADYEFREALLETAPFDMGDQRDLGAALMILANRDVDLHGTAPTELASLAQVHGRPDNQPLHCLRLPEQDEPDGSQAALQNCRDNIRRLVSEALAGLDESGQPLADRYTTFDAFLHFTSVTEVRIPESHLATGRALHAMQDSFTHMYRTPDGRRVLTVLNYAELAEDELDEEIDGPAHSGVLDQCDDAEEVNVVRRELATEASARLLGIVFTPGISADVKMQQVDVLLDDYLTAVDEDCTASNEWCNAPGGDLSDPEPISCGHVMTDLPPEPPIFGLGLLGLFLLARPRRRRSGLLAAGLAAAILFAPSESEASDFGVQLALSAGVENAGFAGSIGGRYRLNEGWLVGLDAEWNPWIGGTVEDVKPGSVNIYATLVKRYPMSFERVDLRTTFEAGISRIMYDVVGVAEGSVGPYLGINLLGLDWNFAENTYLVVDPAHISVPIPQVRGVPFAYVQYQIRLGIQYGG